MVPEMNSDDNYQIVWTESNLPCLVSRQVMEELGLKAHQRIDRNTLGKILNRHRELAEAEIDGGCGGG